MRTHTATLREQLLHAALAAAGRGWHIFPLVPNRKTPAITAWPERATTDVDKIEYCWATGPYNVGIACQPSKLVVIDLDMPKTEEANTQTGEELFNTLACNAAANNSRSASTGNDTYRVRTPSGGLHLYFVAPADVDMASTTGRIGSLIDTRARGGYIVAAGSVIDSVSYAIDNNEPIQPLPAWIANALTVDQRHSPSPPRLATTFDNPDHRDRYLHAALQSERERVLQAPEGTRNHTLNRAAFNLGQLVQRDRDVQLLTEHLTTAAIAAGLSLREAERTIHSGLTAGQKYPRTRPA